MSIQINWDAITGGPDGEALAETIRAFIHERFQQVTLPKLIRSVKVHSFDFGTIAPELELKDVCDPLADFYDDDEDDDSVDGHPSTTSGTATQEHATEERVPQPTPRQPASSDRQNEYRKQPQRPSLETSLPPGSFMRQHLGPQNPFLSRTNTPGIPGGTSNMGYFHLPLSSGLSGAATPLATAVGAQFAAGWPDSYRAMSYNNEGSSSPEDSRRESFSSRRNTLSSAGHDDHETRSPDEAVPDKSVEDVQIVTRFKYSGDIKLSLTAEILLDYPMPSFVGIPLKLNVTGLTFDGVAIVAYIKSKAHFCFLAPEDADALIGRDVVLNMEGDDAQEGTQRRKPVGGLFEEIKVESEIGQKMNGKQVLKNVGKVEKFVLEQVRRIFESEFVYPSFWTFLV